MKKIALAAFAAASLCTLPALAQSWSPGWYVGAGIGRGTLNISGTDLGLPNASVGDNTTTYTGHIGFQFHPNWAIELAYYDLGEYDFSSSVGNASLAGTAKAKAYAVNAVGIWPLGDAFDIYGRLGYGNAELKANASAGGFVANSIDREGSAFYGVGAHWYFTKNWGLFAEWMKADKIKVDSYLGGIELRF